MLLDELLLLLDELIEEDEGLLLLLLIVEEDGAIELEEDEGATLLELSFALVSLLIMLLELSSALVVVVVLEVVSKLLEACGLLTQLLNTKANAAMIMGNFFFIGIHYTIYQRKKDRYFNNGLFKRLIQVIIYQKLLIFLLTLTQRKHQPATP